MAIRGLGNLTNAQVYELAQEKSATFASHTANITAEQFFASNLGGIDADEMYKLRNEFLQTLLTFKLGEIRGHRTKNSLEAADVGVRYYDEYHGARQVMFVSIKKPVNPQFLNLQDGDSVDQDVVRKPVVYDKFFCKNLNFTNFISWQGILAKDAFNGAGGYGVTEALGWVLRELQDSYTKQMYLAQKEVINYALNTDVEADKLKDAQVVEVEFTDPDAPTKDELRNLVNVVKDIKDAMTVEDTGAFNALGWEDIQNEEDLRFIVRPSFINKMQTALYADTYNKDDLKMDIKIAKLNNFGGLVPTKDGTLETKLNEQYDKLGAVVGFTETVESEEVPYEGTVKYYDPNTDVIGIVADKAFLEINESNPFITRVHQNDMGLYDNYIVHKVGDGVYYRADHNFVVIKKKTANQ